MGHIYFEKKEIPVPPGAHSDGDRVYVIKDIGGGKTVRIYIGEYASRVSGEETFYPNEAFRRTFPALWEQYYGENPWDQAILQCGLYSISLAIGHHSGLYPALYESFGPLYGNAVMDFAMYSIGSEMNTAYTFKSAMEFKLLFSKERFDDERIGKMFDHEINKGMLYTLKVKWLQECKARGISSVWLCVDGSNNNCEAEKATLGRKGKAKSKLNIPIIAYMYAVSAVDGTPVAYSVSPGDTVDSVAFTEIVKLLQDNGIEIRGFILDRGFLTDSVMAMIREGNYQYVIKLKSNTIAFKTMFDEYSDTIPWNPEYLVGRGGRFGVRSKEEILVFHSYKEKAFVSFYYDGTNGSARRVTLCDKLFDAIEEANQKIANGEKPSFTGEMAKYLSVENVEQESKSLPDPAESADAQPLYRVVIKGDDAKKAVCAKGFDALASSLDLSAREMDELYDLRDTSEKQFMIFKNMLGSDVFRSHTDQGIEARAVVCFVASILRNEIMKTCHIFRIRDIQRFINDLDNKLFLHKSNNTGYYLIDKMSLSMKQVFQRLGYQNIDFETIAGDASERMRKADKGLSQYRDTPENIRKRNSKTPVQKAVKPGGEKDSSVSNGIDPETPVKKRRGRKPGSKNKSTLEREAREAAEGIVKIKRGKGRPPGSKNKKTLEREAREAAAEIVKVKRGKGRPAGSKDSKPRYRRTKAELQLAAEKAKADQDVKE